MEERQFHLDEINLHSLRRDLLRNWWIPLALAVSFWMAASVYSQVSYSPSYRSEATFVVSAKGSTSAYSSLSLTTNMAQVFSQVFESNMLRSAVEEKLDMPDQDWYISAQTISQTNLMVVSVVSSSPKQSFLALSAVIECYPELAQQVFGNAILEVINDPKVPTYPFNAVSTDKLEKTALLAGFVVGVAILVLMSVLRNTVQTTAAARRRIDGRYLRSIRHEEKNKTARAKRNHKNVAPLISNPFVSAGFREDYQGLSSKLEYHMRKRDQKVIMISSASENEGKSTVAANLALSLASRNKKVALIDCDFRKPALHKIFSIKCAHDHTLSYYLGHSESEVDVLQYQERLGICLAVNGSGGKYAQRLIGSAKMRTFVDRLRREMDYVILDTPPMLAAADAEAVGSYADVAVLVIREDWTLCKSINDCLDSFRRTVPDTAGYVINNCYENIPLFGK